MACPPQWSGPRGEGLAVESKDGSNGSIRRSRESVVTSTVHVLRRSCVLYNVELRTEQLGKQSNGSLHVNVGHATCSIRNVLRRNVLLQPTLDCFHISSSRPSDLVQLGLGQILAVRWRCWVGDCQRNLANFLLLEMNGGWGWRLGVCA